MLSIERIQDSFLRLFPNSKVAEFLPFIEETFRYADITTVKRVAMFQSQVGIECKMFTDFEEDLANYSPERMVKVWKTRFRMPSPSERDIEFFEKGKRNPYFYVKHPEKLANFVYGGRLGNRPEKYGDGWRFIGRGPKQLTGADNYVRFQKAMKGILDKDYINSPEELLNPRDGLYAACWFWKVNKLNVEADQGDIVQATKIVTGSDTLLLRREALYKKALIVLS